MSVAQQPDRHVLAVALALANKGYLVFPCLPFSKEPATTHGFKDASAEPTAIRGWFDNDKGYNLAIATGLQPNEIHLGAIDIDPKNGGDATWKALTDRHGVPLLPRHDTPHGGCHLFANSDLIPTGPNKLGKGIDTRGSGGYVVAPPSRLTDDDGEIIRYSTSNALALVYNDPPPLTPWIATILTTPDPVAQSVSNHPASQRRDEDSPFERARPGWVWELEVTKDGWVEHSRSGGDINYTRPGKDPRQGKSAQLHASGAFVVFTTERPFGGKPTNGAGGATFSPGEYVLAYRCGGDWKEYFRLYPGERYGAEAQTGAAPRVRAAPGGDSTGDGQVPPAVGETVPLYPDRAFYEQRAWLQMCRQMAEAVGGSPAAHTLAYLCRWATLIPPGYSIPAINGAVSSFDLIGVIAGTSGSGKTSPMTNARMLLPFMRDDIKEVPGLGSGEGIIERFYGMIERPGDEGKKQTTRGRAVFGCHFSISEGAIFAELNQRAGTNHATRLCDAWSGAPLATPNASAETFRQVDAGQYRLSAVLGIQVDKAHELMTDSTVSQGFVGRLLFAWAEEPRVRPRPEQPFAVTLPVPPPYTWPGTKERPWPLYQPFFLDYPEAVVTECQEASDARVGASIAVEEHHHDLMRLKVAGVVALMEGRTVVEMDDWAIATTLCEHSRAVREHLKAHRRVRQRDARHTAAMLRADTEIIVDDLKERRNIAKLAETLRDFEGYPEGRRKVARAVTSSKTRHRFEPAVSLAVHNGWIKDHGEVLDA